jgi:hypothetical protein
VISAALPDTGSQSVIVVTDKPHTRRVYTLWREFDAGRGKAIVHGGSDGSYNPSRWWKTPGGTTLAMHEVLGMINASAGLPVQTAMRLLRPVAENNAQASSQDEQPLKTPQPVDSD